MKQTDERDIIFSRLAYRSGSAAHTEYYARHPERKEADEVFRKKPPMGETDAAFYDPLFSPLPDACFAFLADIKAFSVGENAAKRAEGTPEAFTRALKGLAIYYGAKLVGITRLKPEHYYSHKGRPEVLYGVKVEQAYEYGIAFAVEMERDMILRAPGLPESVAVTKGYIDAAIIGMVLSYYIRALGYDARNHMDGSYELVVPCVAQDAGLGEIGRIGVLVTREYGPRVRLGVVSTNMPLLADEPAELGIAAYCGLCSNCAASCPGRALPNGDMHGEDGEWRWKTEADKCFAMWQLLGTDCGICLASCPFGSPLPAALTENLHTREGREALLAYCKQQYPRRVHIKEKPDWMKP